jgi:hypothetical protein
MAKDWNRRLSEAIALLKATAPPGLTGDRHVVATAFAAWAVVVGSAGCDDDSRDFTTPTTIQHVLRVQANGPGSGTVTSRDESPQISCTITAGALSGTCGKAYPSNSTVQLIATPNGKSTFTEWSGACTGTDQCVVDMSQERTVTASFASAQ